MLFGHGRQQQIKDNDNDVKITNPWWFFFSFEEIHEHTHELLKKKQSKRLFFERNMTELTKLRIIYLKNKVNDVKSSLTTKIEAMKVETEKLINEVSDIRRVVENLLMAKETWKYPRK